MDILDERNAQLTDERHIAILFGRQLKFLRKGQNLTQRAVADFLSVGESTYANWEQGRTQPSIQHLIQLTVLFGIDYNELFDFFND